MVIDFNQDPQEGDGDALPNFNNPTPDQDEVHEDEHVVGGVQGGGNHVFHTFDLNGEVVEEDEYFI
jgi:hypothetical protein